MNAVNSSSSQKLEGSGMSHSRVMQIARRTPRSRWRRDSQDSTSVVIDRAKASQQ